MALHTPLTQLLATVIRSPINKLNTYGTDTVLDKLYEYNVSPLITLEFVFMSIQSIHISIPQFKFALQLLASSIEDASMFQLYPFLTYMSLHSLYIKL